MAKWRKPMTTTEPPRYRVMMKTDGRIVIPKKLREAMNAQNESLLQLSLYGKNRVLVEVLTT